MEEDHDDDETADVEVEQYQLLEEEDDDEEWKDSEEDQVVKSELPPVSALLVDRAMKRLEDDYERTIQAKWSTSVEQQRVDRLLDAFELRITAMEDIHDDLNELESFQPLFPSEKKRSPPLLQVESIKQQARSMSLEIASNTEWTRNMFDRLSVAANNSENDAWIKLALEKLNAV